MPTEDRPEPALPRPGLLPEMAEIGGKPGAFSDDRPEPTLAATPFLVEFEEPERLDPERNAIVPEEPTPTPQRMRIRGPIGSLGFHCLALLVIVTATSAPPEIIRPIPIELVLEAPEPEPPPQPALQPAPPAPSERPPLPRLASEDIGGPTETPKLSAPGDPAPATPKPAPEPVAAPAPPPPPPKPTPPQEQIALVAPTPTAPAPLAPIPTPTAVTPPRPPTEPSREGARRAPVPGPAASRDEYLAYLVTLTRQHFDLLPLSVIGDRRGETALGVLVMADGTIARISISRGSGYPDIDRRIEQMVKAVHRFPPLPQWYQGQSMELVFRLRFPEGLKR